MNRILECMHRFALYTLLYLLRCIYWLARKVSLY